MPVMNGAEATVKLREGGYSGLVVGMTGDPSGCEDRDSFEASGLDLCVDKTREGMGMLTQILAAAIEAATSPNGTRRASLAPATPAPPGPEPGQEPATPSRS
jgi:hypothetical protein